MKGLIPWFVAGIELSNDWAGAEFAVSMVKLA
jgi:hypothetical protein